MQHSEKIDLVAAALVQAQAQAGGVAKGGTHDFDKYKYAKLEDIVKIAKPLLAENDLCILVTATNHRIIEGRVTSKGVAQYACAVDLVGTILHKSGQWIQIEGVGEGQDRGDKSVYKAITGGRKYLIAQALDLVTTDDPEADGMTGRDPQQQTGSRPVSDGGSTAMPTGGPLDMKEF